MAFSLGKIFASLTPDTSVVARSVVGIDIGSAAIKVVELERGPDGPVLKTYGEIQLGPYADQALGEPITADGEILKKSIVDVIREAGVTAKQGVLSLPLTAGFVTVITLNKGENETVESRIPVEARKYIPVPLGEVTLDWVELASAEADDTHATVLLVALQNESLRTYTTLLSDIALANQPMELETFSTYRGVATTDESIAVLDIGAQVAKLYVFESGTLVKIHRVAAGGAHITTKYAAMQNLSFAEAEVSKRSVEAGTDQYRDVQKATAAVLDGPLHEFRRILQQYEKVAATPISQLYLSGGVAATPTIAPLIADQLQRPASIAQPFDKVAYPAFMEDTVRAIGPTFTNSVGAALRLLE